MSLCGEGTPKKRHGRVAEATTVLPPVLVTRGPGKTRRQPNILRKFDHVFLGHRIREHVTVVLFRGVLYLAELLPLFLTRRLHARASPPRASSHCALCSALLPTLWKTCDRCAPFTQHGGEFENLAEFLSPMRTTPFQPNSAPCTPATPP